MSGTSSDIEKGNGAPLQRSETLSMSPEVYEKLFLNPQTKVAGDLRKTFAVPTPLGLIGFGVALTPLACQLLGWRGTDQSKLAAADLASYIWFGGLMTELAGLLEFFLGNTFAFVLFMGYGSWFLTYATTLMPFYGASAAYAPSTMMTANATLPELSAAGQMTPGFTASFAFPVVFMAVLSIIFLICALRVNLIFVLVLVGAVIAFTLLAAALFVESEAIRMLGEAAILAEAGNTAAAGPLLAKGEARLALGFKLVKGGGGAFFGAAMLGWYLTLAVMLAIIDFPIVLPVFDLSTVIKGRTQLEAERRAKME